VLADELARAKERQQLQEWQANEQKLAESLGPIAKPDIGQDVRDRLAIFIAFCKSHNVRHCPARPATVAAFAKAEAANGRDPQGIVSLLAAVSALHDHHSLANPTATTVVGAALNQVIEIEPAPRSWRADEKSEWAKLPPDIRQAIARREEQRDQALRQAQNRLAEERKRLQSGADKPVQTNEGLSI
jgi:hypothetical protein